MINVFSFFTAKSARLANIKYNTCGLLPSSACICPRAHNYTLRESVLVSMKTGQYNSAAIYLSLGNCVKIINKNIQMLNRVTS